MDWVVDYDKQCILESILKKINFTFPDNIHVFNYSDFIKAISINKSQYKLCDLLKCNPKTITRFTKLAFPSKQGTGFSLCVYILGLDNKKYCTNCNKVKAFSEFAKKSMGSFGLKSWCSICTTFDNKARICGITKIEHSLLFKQQNSACAICKRKFINERSAAIDHDHNTGKIRGLLCRQCNTSLGTFGDSKAGILNVLAYLRGENHA